MHIRSRHIAACLIASAWVVLGPPTKAQDAGAPPPPMPPGYKSADEVKAAAFAGKLKLISPPVVPATVVETRDIEYANVDGNSLKLDLCQPKDLSQPAPCLIFIHGGAWRKGNRADYRPYTIPYAEKGYVTATISYRLSDVAKYPAAVHDAKSAVKFLRANAEKYKIDPNRMAVIGGSAGGHLSLMVGYTADDPALEPKSGLPGVSDKVQAVVDLYGPTDFTTDEARNAREITSFLGKTYDQALDVFAQASPITHVTKDDPPTLILHGTIDEVVTIKQSDALAARLKEVGVPFEYEQFPGWPHTMDIADPVNKRTQYDMDRFFDKYLKPAGSDRTAAAAAK